MRIDIPEALVRNAGVSELGAYVDVLRLLRGAEQVEAGRRWWAERWGVSWRQAQQWLINGEVHKLWRLSTGKRNTTLVQSWSGGGPDEAPANADNPAAVVQSWSSPGPVGPDESPAKADNDPALVQSETLADVSYTSNKKISSLTKTNADEASKKDGKASVQELYDHWTAHSDIHGHRNMGKPSKTLTPKIKAALREYGLEQMKLIVDWLCLSGHNRAIYNLTNGYSTLSTICLNRDKYLPFALDWRDGANQKKLQRGEYKKPAQEREIPGELDDLLF